MLLAFKCGEWKPYYVAHTGIAALSRWGFFVAATVVALAYCTPSLPYWQVTFVHLPCLTTSLPRHQALPLFPTCAPLVPCTYFHDRSRSCHVSDSGGAAVYSPQGPGGSRARKGEHAAAVARYASGARERPISQVLQAGQDEIGAGAGAVAVSVTPEELGQACLIGQVREVSGCLCANKFIQLTRFPSGVVPGWV